MNFSKGFSLILYILLVIVELFPIGIHNISLYLFVLWIILSWIAFSNVFYRVFSQRRYVLFFIFLVFYFLSTSIGKGFFQGFVYTMYMLRVVSPILMYDILKTYNIKTKRLFVSCLLIIFLVYAFWMFQLISFYGAELGLKGSIVKAENEDHVSSAFGYIYSLPILIVMLVISVRSFIKQKKDIITGRGWIRILIGLFLIACFSLLILRSLFMTAIVLLITGVCLGLFYNNTGKKWIVKSLLAISLLMIVFVTQFDKISSDVNQVGSASMDQRVEELYLSLTGKSGSAADMGARRNLTLVSIETFLMHPIFGANHLLGDNRFQNDIIGNHAEWPDILGLYGLFALVLFYFIYKSLKLQYYDTRIIVPTIIYVLTGFLNPMFFFVVNLTMFVIVPLLNSFSINKN